MKFVNGDWEVDATPDCTIGLHFPHVRISQRSPDGSLALVYDSGRLDPVQSAEDAPGFAERFAAEWISWHRSNRLCLIKRMQPHLAVLKRDLISMIGGTCGQQAATIQP